MLKRIAAAVNAALDEILPEGLAHDFFEASDVPSFWVDDVQHLKRVKIKKVQGTADWDYFGK